MTTLHVAASVQSDQPETITRAFEAFGRAAVGLALEGAQITIDVGPRPRGGRQRCRLSVADP